MASNPNESGSYDVIHASKWSKGGKGEKKTRLVVIKFRGKKSFAVRWQTPTGDNGPTFGGSSFQSEEKAHESFMRAYLRHNGKYKNGNISHFPGIAK